MPVTLLKKVVILNFNLILMVFDNDSKLKTVPCRRNRLQIWEKYYTGENGMELSIINGEKTEGYMMAFTFNMASLG